MKYIDEMTKRMAREYAKSIDEAIMEFINENPGKLKVGDIVRVGPVEVEITQEILLKTI